MVIKGLKEIQERSAETENLFNENKTKHLFLEDGDVAIIRFISDEQMIQTKIHEYEEMAPTGKKYRKTYCVDNLMGVHCKWCAAGNVPKNIYVFLAYVYHIIHKRQNPRLDLDLDAPKWEPIKQGNQVFYREDVGDVRVVRIKWGKDSVMKNTIMQFINEYGSLCDRDYKYSRIGSSIKTTYSLIPKDPSKISSEVKAAIKSAPSIDEVVGIKDSAAPTEQRTVSSESTKAVDDITAVGPEEDSNDPEDLF